MMKHMQTVVLIQDMSALPCRLITDAKPFDEVGPTQKALCLCLNAGSHRIIKLHTRFLTYPAICIISHLKHHMARSRSRLHLTNFD